MNYLKRYQDMIRLRGLTDNTVKNYSTYISAYLDYVSERLNRRPSQVTWQQKRDFIQWIQQERNLSDRTINAVISQLRFFTLYVLHKPWDPYQLPFRKFDQYVPFVPSRDEITAFINAIDDLKAKVIIILMYSCGLRIGEAVHLRYEDISRSNMKIHVSKSKNRSDRYLPLSPFVLDALTHYWRVYGKPRGYLFRTRFDPSKTVTAEFMRLHINKTEQKLGWPHRFTCHSFRHAFATHFYEDHQDLLTLKTLLGHRSINSTTVYVDLSNATFHQYASPIESLQVSYE